MTVAILVWMFIVSILCTIASFLFIKDFIRTGFISFTDESDVLGIVMIILAVTGWYFIAQYYPKLSIGA